jgi:hypothetical protein
MTNGFHLASLVSGPNEMVRGGAICFVGSPLDVRVALKWFGRV